LMAEFRRTALALKAYRAGQEAVSAGPGLDPERHAGNQTGAKLIIL
jgi:hypothetical protein